MVWKTLVPTRITDDEEYQEVVSDENERESVKVLRECIELQLRKSRDYQNPNSNVRQADHYLHGINTIYDMLHQKMLRARSLLEVGEQGADAPNFESIEDTFKDIVNYASFGVSYLRGKMDGQDPKRDVYNRKRGFTVSPGVTIEEKD